MHFNADVAISEWSYKLYINTDALLGLESPSEL